MMDLLLPLVLVFFPASEVAIAVFKRGSPDARANDRGSMRLIWVVIVCAVALAVVASTYRAAGLPLSAGMQALAAAILLVGGLMLRWTAILTLGRYFTANVAVQADQAVVATGPYRYLRHPSYTGLLLAFLGLGVFFGNWLSLAVLMVPITLALVYRIRIEESVLAEALGPACVRHAASTKRLVPWVW
jgi:protein-S-isoprenylcysteine O-methyltransferase